MLWVMYIIKELVPKCLCPIGNYENLSYLKHFVEPVAVFPHVIPQSPDKR